jgi:hypothetical protein
MVANYSRMMLAKKQINTRRVNKEAKRRIKAIKSFDSRPRLVKG